jgi:hypothetical protein
VAHVRQPEVERHEASATGQHVCRLRVAERADRVEDHVIRPGQGLGCGLAVVDEPIRAQLHHQLGSRGRGDTRHLRAQRPGDLHRVGADTARRADDEDLLAGLHIRESVEELQRTQRAEGQRRRLRVGQGVRRLQNRAIGLHLHVFRMGAAQLHPEHPVAFGKLRHARADLGHGAREIAAEHRLAGPEDTEHQPARDRGEDPREGRGAKAPVRRGHARRTDTDEDLALARFRTRDLAHLHHFGATISIVDCRFHL